jgi:hypothetical protein
MENIGRQRKSRIPDVSQVCVTLFELDGNLDRQLNRADV